MSRLASRGEIWLVELQDGGRVPAGAPVDARTRPRSGAALIVSADGFNHGPAGSLLALPVTTVARRR